MAHANVFSLKNTNPTLKQKLTEMKTHETKEDNFGILLKV
jgi:hypothetical protein